MAAARTEAVEFQPVSLNREAIACGDFFLKLFDFAIFEFDDLAATRADQVVMMTLMRHVVVLCLGVKMAGLRNAGVAKQVQGSVDGGESQMRVRLGELMIHGFGGNVFLP